ncbi:hypothetical protein ADIWIN_1007 [Winogradskyella psychrotolerans RS-3]|uniref:Uncharacterized protein n=2 Tax=Winogradskyella TaxID=286104 RepID=S7VX98_9FLAO|nr:hypothetical protein [Winogradskyella psychrotolerans]EPR74047.1 hypothetical protein ADIWIN_1007 [Winogradskyella psychrotolerans RS-3]
MKKKVFSLMAVVLFMSSSLNLNANVQNEDLDTGTCFDVAAEAEQNFMNNMATRFRIIPRDEIAYNVFAAAYDGCVEAGGPS